MNSDAVKPVDPKDEENFRLVVTVLLALVAASRKEAYEDSSEAEAIEPSSNIWVASVTKLLSSELSEVERFVPSHNPALVNSVAVPTNLITTVELSELRTDEPLCELQKAVWEAVSNLLNVSGSRTRVLLSLITILLNEAI